MEYLIVFFEGIITFVSPCLLPMLPLYILYFAGGEKQNRKNTFINSLGFVFGFTIVFTLLGALSGMIGGFLIKNQILFNIVAGVIVIIFGLNHLGVIKISFLNKSSQGKQVKITNVFSAILFGALFSISWTPCVGAFLGSALTMAARMGSMLHGATMLFVYSLGLGIPFVISALIIDQLKGAFDFIKRHYGVINKISGVFLVVMGVLMATGYMGKLMSILSF